MRLNLDGAEGDKTLISPHVSKKESDAVVKLVGDSGQDAESKSNLFTEIARKASSVSHVSRLIDQTVRMAKEILNASASSVLLVDEDKQELFFEFADGEAGGALKEVRIGIQSGIAGWVASHGRPIVVNDVARDHRFYKGVDRTTGFTTKSIMCAPLEVRKKVIGVIEVLNKLDESDFTEQDLEALKAVASTAALAIDNLRINEELLYGYSNAVRALATAIDEKDPYTRGHSQRVKEYALLGARALPLSPWELEAIEYAGVLHDIGKIGIPDATLRKAGPLTSQEWALMRNHPRIGSSIVGSIPRLEEVRELIVHHHEHYDGTGYPRGLKGESIPIGARLLAVADAFDTMTTNRAYRGALSMGSAIEELRRCSGTQFCPVAVEAFISSFMSRQGYLSPPYY
ncbi:MAG TPA: HD domain-containing phosphohydrolase [Dehalococcoidia bacterium]|nr:HD domain-containing phosphohydrolase [Dehalococcoidia bacterium]